MEKHKHCRGARGHITGSRASSATSDVPSASASPYYYDNKETCPYYNNRKNKPGGDRGGASALGGEVIRKEGAYAGECFSRLQLLAARMTPPVGRHKS
jgi:hypothetical protein